jgi:hypothetical protein
MVRRILKLRPRPPMRNNNNGANRKVYVSVHKGIQIPTLVKRYMRTLSPVEKAKKNQGAVEIASQFNVLFDKDTLKIIDMKRLNVGTGFKIVKDVIEYAVRKNLSTLTSVNKKYILDHWNGYMFVNIKKEVSGSYAIPWHRDALAMELLGKKTKSFAVGALYVNIPKDIVGGNIQFKRNNKFFSLAPKSGPSVLFIDDELFHKVTDIEPPTTGVKYLPRSALFMAYGTDKTNFKKGLAEHRITKGNRNYENAYRRMPQNLKNKLNQILNNKTIINVNYPRNVRMSNENFAANLYKRALISELNRYARTVFNSNTANHKNLITLYTNMKKAFGGSSRVNKSFVSTSKERSPRLSYGLLKTKKSRLLLRRKL